MGQNDNNKADCADKEEDMFLNRVICGEYELLYLDTYLRETLSANAGK